MTHGFRGGVHPAGGKELTSGRAVEPLPAPAMVTIPVSMHVGAPCSPLVAVGDHVCMGQVIADTDAPLSAPIHSSVSGTVKKIEPMLHPNGTHVMTVVIENDGLDTPADTIKPHTDEIAEDPAKLVDIMHDAGIVGAGGAAFPAFFKLQGAMGKADTIIINASECEPFITCDHRLLLEDGGHVVAGAKLLRDALGLDKVYIGTEANKKTAISHLREIIAGEPGVELIVFRTRYPQGAEKQLIRAVTGREVPPGGLPADVGCAVFNAYTAWGVWRAVEQGVPAIDRIVTVSGPGVNEPGNFRVRVGTPIRELIDAAGGIKDGYFKVVMGGPMMGNAVFDIDVPVLKATGSVLVLGEAPAAKNPTCIRCGRCVGVCPMHLSPLYLYMYERKSDLDMLTKLNVRDCMECGSCAYICPGRLPLVQSIRSAKQKLNAAGKK
ncbi:MAG: electron transport complex subunit RsxC [Oscillospiraceae bacterium]|nr:electron transport complex subunit RsxC [Oscillospiraceae bacterium]